MYGYYTENVGDSNFWEFKGYMILYELYVDGTAGPNWPKLEFAAKVGLVSSSVGQKRHSCILIILVD